MTHWVRIEARTMSDTIEHEEETHLRMVGQLIHEQNERIAKLQEDLLKSRNEIVVLRKEKEIEEWKQFVMTVKWVIAWTFGCFLGYIIHLVSTYFNS